MRESSQKAHVSVRAEGPHIAVLLEPIGYDRDIFRGVADYARIHGPWMLIRHDRFLAHQEIRSGRIDGVIAAIGTAAEARRLRPLGVPTVNVSSAIETPGFPAVGADDVAVGRLAARYWLDRGLRHLAFLGISSHFASVQRGLGFAEALAEAHQPEASRHLVKPTMSWRAYFAGLEKWLSGLPKPVGVFAFNDVLAVDVLDACRRRGLRVPDDVAVLGVDNDEFVCETALPPVSSIDPGARRLGFEAAALLSRIMRGQTPPARILVPPVGVVSRASSEIIAIDDLEVVQALRFIRAARRPIKVHDVLAHVPVPRRALERRFRDAMQRTLHDEIARVRIERTRELLARTSLSLEAVTAAAGFRHLAHMSTVFRKATALTPLAYRRQHSPPATP